MFMRSFFFSGKLHVIFVFKRKISSKQQISFLKLWFKSYTFLRHETENSWVIVSFLSVFQLFTNRKLVTLHHPHIVRRRNSFVVSKTQFFIHQVYSCSLVSLASVSHLLTEELHFLKSRVKVTWPEYDNVILVDYLIAQMPFIDDGKSITLWHGHSVDSKPLRFNCIRSH